MAKVFKNIPPVAHPLTVAYTATVSTSGWAAGTYSVIVPADVLGVGIYAVQIRFDKSGTDNLMQSLLLPICTTDTNQAQQTNLLSANTASYIGSTSNSIMLRHKKGTATQGLEGSPSSSSLVGGTIVVTVYQL